jgi:hypothetical protein
VPNLFASAASATKKITKEWTVGNNTDLTFVTKYQDAEIVFWKENKVKLDVDIRSASDKVDADDLAGRIYIASESDNNNLVISVKMKDDRSSSIWGWVFGSKNIEISINSTLYVPYSLGNFTVKSSYSDIKCTSVPVNFSLKCNYGDIRIGEVKRATVISANYSDIQIDKADNIEVSTNYGDIKISSGDQLKINSTYTDFSIGQIIRSLTAISVYSDIKIQALGKNFTSVNCRGEYSDISLNLNDANPIQLDLRARNGDIYNGGLQLVRIQEEDENGDSLYKGKTRTASGSSPTIVVNTTYGDISLRKDH